MSTEKSFLGSKRQAKYGSTSSNTQHNETYAIHDVLPTDTLAGLALRYGTTIEHIKRVNKLWTNDSIFLRHHLKIPVTNSGGSSVCSGATISASTSDWLLSNGGSRNHKFGTFPSNNVGSAARVDGVLGCDRQRQPQDGEATHHLPPSCDARLHAYNLGTSSSSSISSHPSTSTTATPASTSRDGSHSPAAAHSFFTNIDMQLNAVKTSVRNLEASSTITDSDMFLYRRGSGSSRGSGSGRPSPRLLPHDKMVESLTSTPDVATIINKPARRQLKKSLNNVVQDGEDDIYQL